MWVIAAVVFALLFAGEAILVLSDKMPWNRWKNKKEDRWWKK